MTETPAEPVVGSISKQRENKNAKKEFVPTIIHNEVDIDVSMLERRDAEKRSHKEMMEE